MVAYWIAIIHFVPPLLGRIVYAALLLKKGARKGRPCTIAIFFYYPLHSSLLTSNLEPRTSNVFHPSPLTPGLLISDL